MFRLHQFVVNLPLKNEMFSSYKNHLVVVGRLAVFRETSIIGFYLDHNFRWKDQSTSHPDTVTDREKSDSLFCFFIFYFILMITSKKKKGNKFL